MAKATKTIRQTLHQCPKHTAWFVATQALYNQVCAFYFDVIQAHPGILELPTKTALTALETLTHTTNDNPHPVMPLSEITPTIPAMFRRAAIHAALGSAHSFHTHLEKWRTRKDKATRKGKKFTERPPVPPRSWKKSAVFYAGQYKGRTAKSILLKLWTGRAWCWLKVHLSGQTTPDEWELGSPTLVQQGEQWRLHTPIEKQFTAPGSVEKQVTSRSDTKICAIDLNITEHLAVCTVQTVEGTVLATRFIRGGKELHGLRKRLLGRIARNRRKTGLIAEGEQDNAALWAKVRAIDEDTAHQVSHRIVQFAQAHGATILVFEHLGHFKPQQGTYSKRGNEKRSYWLGGRLFHYAKYKGWNEHIVTSRVNPRNTSRECARCHCPVARYNAGQPAEGYTPGASLVLCSDCQMRGNADRNASLVIGQRLLARYQTHSQEKPPTPLHAERSLKKDGDARSQDAKRRRRPSSNQARHGTSVEHGTAQDGVHGMANTPSGIPR